MKLAREYVPRCSIWFCDNTESAQQQAETENTESKYSEYDNSELT